MSETLFISDLHLAEHRPASVEMFERFLAERAPEAQALYILGDLFDVWIGDDDDAELAERIRTALARLSQFGTRLFIQQGNRDFLLGRRFCRATGAELLPDCRVIDLAGQPTLLMHGDLLCTDDVDYQKLRKRFRGPLFKLLVRLKSLNSRRAIAAGYRAKSKQAMAEKQAEIMDVNAATVIDYLQRHRVKRLIHGHTHRPADHQITMPDGSRASRVVLDEWHEDRAEILVARSNELIREIIR